jgi:hypothetical protein
LIVGRAIGKPSTAEVLRQHPKQQFAEKQDEVKERRMLRATLKVSTLTAGLAVMLIGLQPACGRGLAAPQFYNPRIYQNNRTPMSNRAAARAALKKRRQARARRHVAPRRPPKVTHRGASSIR